MTTKIYVYIEEKYNSTRQILQCLIQNGALDCISILNIFATCKRVNVDEIKNVKSIVFCYNDSLPFVFNNLLKSLTKFPLLTKLYCKDTNENEILKNYVSDYNMRYLSNLQLKQLTLAKCHRLNDSGLVHSKNLKLTKLDISERSLHDISIGLYYPDVSKLIASDISNLLKTTDDGLLHLANSQIKQLTVSGCKFTIIEPPHRNTKSLPLVKLNTLNFDIDYVKSVLKNHKYRVKTSYEFTIETSGNLGRY